MKNLVLSLCFLATLSSGYNQVTTNYCTPTYGTVCVSGGTNDLIDDFSTTGGITNISNLNSGCNLMPNNYQFVGQTVTTIPGAVINFTIVSGITYSQGFAVWIDWNQDFDFTDPGEKVYESPNASFQPFLGSFTVPAGQGCDDYRMRVRSNYAVGGANITPCDPQTFGETEDYTVTVTNCSSQERTICEGQTATIDYSSLLPATPPITVVVTPMTNVTITIPTISFNPLDSAEYQIVWTSPDSSWIDSAYIHVNDPLNPTFAGLNDSVCDGGFLALQATPANSNTDFEWTIGYPGVTTTASYFPTTNPSNNPTTANTNIISNDPGSVYAIFTESDTLNICPSVIDTALIIFSEEFHLTSNSNPTCNGFTDGQIQVNSFGTLGAVEYSIDNGFSWSTNNLFQNLPAGVYPVISRDIIGCTFSSTVTLVDPPEITIAVGADTTVCQNGTAQVSATSTNGQFFNWNFIGGLSGNQVILPISDSTVTVHATNIAGCSSDTLSITVNVYDPITGALSTSIDTICPGDPVRLEITPQGGYQGYDFAWTLNSNTTSLVTSILNENPSANTNYCVTVTDGCESTPYVECQNIVMRPIPTTNFTTTILKECVPAKAIFRITTPDYLFGQAKISVGGQQYAINNNTNFIDSIVHTFNEVGDFDFYMQITSPFGCVNDTTAFQEVTSFPIPEPTFYLTPETATIFQPVFETVNLTDGNNTYEWIMVKGEPNSSTSKNMTVRYPDGQAGQYPIDLIAISDQGCTDTVTGFAIVENDIVIYAPNTFTPDGDSFNDTWRVFIEGIDVYNFRMLIYNRWGEIVFESFDPTTEWDGTLRNGNAVQPGTYVWFISTNDISSSETFEFRGTINIIE